MLRCVQSLYLACWVSSEIGGRPARIRNSTSNITFVMQSRRHIMITALAVPTPESLIRLFRIQEEHGSNLTLVTKYSDWRTTLWFPWLRCYGRRKVPSSSILTSFFQALIDSSFLFSQFILCFAATTIATICHGVPCNGWYRSTDNIHLWR